MKKITVNLHNKSSFSGGHHKYHDIAQAGLTAGIDCIIVTDNNVLVMEKEQYYYRDEKRVLLLTGEEIFRPFPNRDNHLLVLNAYRELTNLAHQTQDILNVANRLNAITILAHPFDTAIVHQNEPGYPWTDWTVQHFTGMEIFNLQSEYKRTFHRSGGLSSLSPLAILSRLFASGQGAFDAIIHVAPEILHKWDELLSTGKQVVGFAGSVCGGLRDNPHFRDSEVTDPETIFRTLNNHVYVDDSFGENVEQDRQLIFNALRVGSSYMAMDRYHSTEGFVFKADTEEGTVFPGGRVAIGNSATLKIEVPTKAVCRLIHQGEIFKEWENVRSIPIIVTEPGYYRVEVYIPYRYELRSWIYTNPIYFY